MIFDHESNRGKSGADAYIQNLIDSGFAIQVPEELKDAGVGFELRLHSGEIEGYWSKGRQGVNLDKTQISTNGVYKVIHTGSVDRIQFEGKEGMAPGRGFLIIRKENFSPAGIAFLL